MVIPRAERAPQLQTRRAEQALHDLGALPIRQAGHRRLLGRVPELRGNATVYDAADLALAELISAPLITAARALAGVPGTVCEVEVLTATRR